MVSVSIRDMLKAGVHFGHQKSVWNPKMAPFVFCTRNSVHIIDLDKSAHCLQVALTALEKLAARRGKLLLVGTKRAASDRIRDAALQTQQFYVNRRWLGGTLTNWRTVRQSIKRLKLLQQQQQEGLFDCLTKKEMLLRLRQIQKLEASLGGIKEMATLPDALFVIDAERERIAIQEANKMGVPVFAVLDTNVSPDGVDYPIPGNDDAGSAVAFYLDLVVAAITAGQARQEGVVEPIVDSFVS